MKLGNIRRARNLLAAAGDYDDDDDDAPDGPHGAANVRKLLDFGIVLASFGITLVP